MGLQSRCICQKLTTGEQSNIVITKGTYLKKKKRQNIRAENQRGCIGGLSLSYHVRLTAKGIRSSVTQRYQVTRKKVVNEMQMIFVLGQQEMVPELST